MNEIKNRRQIRRLVTLPYDLKILDPDIKNVQFIIEFAKKTGDYLSLSHVDIKVIALTYELEKQHVGIDHLRTEPIQKTIISSAVKPKELIDDETSNNFFGFKSAAKTNKDDSIEIDEKVEKLIIDLEKSDIIENIGKY